MARSEPRQLVLLNRASRMLAEATSLDEIRLVRDTAEAARTYAKAAQLSLELQNRATEIKLRAERKAGTMLAKLHLRGGDRRSKTHCLSVTLRDLGIAQHQSKRWQLVAMIPESDFCQYVQSKNLGCEELTTSGLLRLARELRRPPILPRKRPNMSSEQAHQTDGDLSQPNDPRELIAELRAHRQLLAQILKPLYATRQSRSAPHWQTGERRAVGHLLQEIEATLGELEQLLQARLSKQRTD